MKQRKRSYANRLFYDFRRLERTLEEMATKGWKLTKVTNLYLEYERMEPRPLHYTVTYFSEASEFRPVPTENQDVFVDYCRESGWELVATWTQMLIFCSEEERPIPIDTDPIEQLSAMHKSMKKGMLPNSYVQIGSFLLLIASRFYGAYTMPEYFYASTSSVMMVVLFLICLVYFISLPLQYFAWHRSATQVVEAGGEIPSPKWSSKLDTLFAVGLIGATLVYFSMIFSESGLWILPFYGGFFLFFLLIFRISRKLQKSGLLAKVWVRVAVVAVVTVASTVVLTTVLFSLIGMGVFSSRDTRFQLDEPLPLALEDFYPIDSANYTASNDVQESFLLKWSNCHQRGQQFDDSPDLNYQVFETEYLFVHRHILADILRINSNEKNLDVQYKTNWREVELPHTTTAYQCYRGDNAYAYDYVLCFGTNIVEVRFDSIFTPQQVDTAIELLAQQFQ